MFILSLNVNYSSVAYGAASFLLLHSYVSLQEASLCASFSYKVHKTMNLHFFRFELVFGKESIDEDLGAEALLATHCLLVVFQVALHGFAWFDTSSDLWHYSTLFSDEGGVPVPPFLPLTGRAFWDFGTNSTCFVIVKYSLT